MKTDFEPNARRSLDLVTARGEEVRRYPVRTELFGRDDDLDARVLAHVDQFFAALPSAGPEHAAATRGPWWFFLSEKVVAIAPSAAARMITSSDQPKRNAGSRPHPSRMKT